jgi:benzoyl-CoA reductase/2-hydroxyglutaryl-CoA dehydratase subunit BcrC/BadD/HgdB
VTPPISAAQSLRGAYEARLERALAQPLPIAGVTSNTVPWELLRAAGFFPVLLSPPRGPTPHADPFMEDVFDARIRGVFERLASGEWSFLRLLVIPRTSEQEHKLFLYVKELARLEPHRELPRTLLYNLLHARSPEAGAYGLDRTRELVRALPGGSADKLYEAIVEGNRAREAVRALQQLREDGRLTGCEALPLIGAFYFMSRSEYAELAFAAAREIAERPRIRGPRVLVKGCPLDHCSLHSAIEAHGATVSAEDDWWGSRAGGQDIRRQGDLIEAVFEKYYLDTPSPRVFPPASADEWFLDTAAGVDGVIFYLPPEDDVFGWDYPRLRAALDRQGIPHLLIRVDASAGEFPRERHDRIEEFVRRLKG